MTETPPGRPALNRTEELMATIRARIENRALCPGEKLPSVRRFAGTMRVSPSTVVEAYDRLAAEGLIHARRGAGFYVSDNAPPLMLTGIGPDQQRDREIDPFWVSRQSLDASPAVLRPGCGWLPEDRMPRAALRSALRAVARNDDLLLTHYGSTKGSLALRRLLLARLAEEGLTASPDQILLTVSGTQAVDLICRLLLRPGDTVLVDDPCYFNFHALLRAHQARIIGIPRTPTGPDIAAFATAMKIENPRLYITSSGPHNPTGGTLSAHIAHRVLSLASAAGVTIIEDDIFNDFDPVPSPSLAVPDGLEHVIRIGSFSKTISASLRCGYIAARPDRIEALADLQIAANFGGPSPVATEVIVSILAGGSYRKHMHDLRRYLARTRETVAAGLVSQGITPWIMPRAGFYLWCELPAGQDALAITRACLERNIILAPGNVFSISQSASRFLRFNVAQSTDPRVITVLQEVLKS